jgi:hypothetical protein
MARTIEFRSETSLAAFISQLPGSVHFHVHESASHAGWYTLTFL